MKAPAQISVRPQNSTRPITCQRIQTLKRHHRLWSAVRVAKALLQPLLWCQEKLLSNINSERGKHNSSMWLTTRINLSRSMPRDSSVLTPSKSKKSLQLRSPKKAPLWPLSSSQSARTPSKSWSTLMGTNLHQSWRQRKKMDYLHRRWMVLNGIKSKISKAQPWQSDDISAHK